MTVVLCPKWAQTLAPQILSAPEMWSLSALGFIPVFSMERASEFPQERLSKYVCDDSHLTDSLLLKNKWTKVQ